MTASTILTLNNNKITLTHTGTHVPPSPCSAPPPPPPPPLSLHLTHKWSGRHPTYNWYFHWTANFTLLTLVLLNPRSSSAAPTDPALPLTRGGPQSVGPALARSGHTPPRSSPSLLSLSPAVLLRWLWNHTWANSECNSASYNLQLTCNESSDITCK